MGTVAKVRVSSFEFQYRVVGMDAHADHSILEFLAGRAIATLLRPSSVVICDVMYCG